MEFRNLVDCDFDTLFKGFGRAFADYEISFQKEEVRTMLERRGFNPLLSFAMFDKEDIAAFTLNGTGIYNQRPTAYDTGTGTAKEYRGLGLAGEIFTRSIPYLKSYGIRQYLLEVLQNNHKAIAMYSKLGFKTIREFDCYRQSITELSFPASVKESGVEIRSVDVETISSIQSFCDFPPSWQNSIESIKRGKSSLTCIAGFKNNKIVGYCVFDSLSGDITQLAVKSSERHKGIGTQLLQHAVNQMQTGFIKLLNISTDNQSFPTFLKQKNIPLTTKQYEMLLNI